MNEPVRLAHQPRGSIEVELIHHARAERPPPGELGRLAVALGVATATASTSPPASANLRVARENARIGVASPAANSLSGAAVRWLIVGSTCVIVAGGAILGYSMLRGDRPSPSLTQASAPPIGSGSEPSDKLPAIGVTNHGPAASAVGGGLASLAPEIALLDRARTLIETGHPAAALSTLDNYDAQFPSGTLSPEARVIRIQALVGAGKRTQAQRLGSEFLASVPSSPHAPRIRELLAPQAPERPKLAQ